MKKKEPIILGQGMVFTWSTLAKKVSAIKKEI